MSVAGRQAKGRRRSGPRRRVDSRTEPNSCGILRSWRTIVRKCAFLSTASRRLVGVRRREPPCREPARGLESRRLRTEAVSSSTDGLARSPGERATENPRFLRSAAKPPAQSCVYWTKHHATSCHITNCYPMVFVSSWLEVRSACDRPRAAAEGNFGGRLFLANEINREIKRDSRRIAAG